MQVTSNAFLRFILPSSHIKKDIVNPEVLKERVRPILLHGLKLIKPIQKAILSKRNSSPKIERSQKKMAMIIPFRNREEHLKIFIPSICQYLDNQNINYELIVVEQIDAEPFNRAKLMNIGVDIASSDVEYFVFHDVDLLPQDIDYRYANHALKLFTYIKQGENGALKEYKQTNFGGATLVSKEWFIKVNGFSNNYWHWGLEDDDFLMRFIFENATPFYDNEGKFTTLPHPKSITQNTDGSYETDPKKLDILKKYHTSNKKRYSGMKRQFSDYQEDGINTLSYKIINDINHALYRQVSVELV
jgi:hypothetical protein